MNKILIITMVVVIAVVMVYWMRKNKPGEANVKEENSFLCKMDNRCDK